ncbi:MAG: phosphomethylpyrimidine synthase ThiC [Clostridia bacterium]|nr:phosphomethylpyrimidine synthase ThiC [Clostridia bacterium]MDH7572068.1 phosphomethylpyrimidine synthase ThiC [Clostridia bacterium]
MTQLEKARRGEVSPEVEQAAQREGVGPETLARNLAEGRVVLPLNPRHRPLPTAIGAGVRIKVNANLGTSSLAGSLEEEKQKLAVALASGADTVMDLSTGPDLVRCRQEMLAACPVPLGTVPVYQAMVRAREEHGAMIKLTVEELFAVIEEQAADGVDFMTVHCGLTAAGLERLTRQGRLIDIVSRGGAFTAAWMLHHQAENPLYAHYDRLLEIARRHDVTLSLGDGLRPGSVADATDRAQVQELLVLGELVDRAREAGVQVMVEGPGHVPLPDIAANVKLEKKLCREAPFYVLGPLVTDVAAGYDHIAAAIGGALAAAAGADFLCYVTPSEHLGLPGPEEVRQGVIAARIAAHAADLAKGLPGAWEWDRAMSRARKALDWEEQCRLAIDPEAARTGRRAYNREEVRTCSMCGDYCAMQLISEHLGAPVGRCS